MPLAIELSPANRLCLIGVASDIGSLAIRLRMAVESADFRKIDIILCDIESAEEIAHRIITQTKSDSNAA